MSSSSSTGTGKGAAEEPEPEPGESSASAPSSYDPRDYQPPHPDDREGGGDAVRLFARGKHSCRDARG